MSNKIKCFKIDRSFCREHCCMIMVPVSKCGVIVGREGVLFSNDETNKYLDDPRRKLFPYTEVPTHYEKKILCEKELFVNQVFDYDNLYTVLESDSCTNYFPFHRSEGGILVRDKYSTFDFGLGCGIYSMSRDNLLSSFTSTNEEDRIVILGGKTVKDGIVIPCIDEVVKSTIEGLESQVANFPSFCAIDDGEYDYSYYALKISREINELENLSNEDLSFDLPVIGDVYILRIPKDGSGYSIDKLHISIDNKDMYRVSVTPVMSDKNNEARIDYSSIGSQKSIDKIKTIKEPVFDEKLNPGISKVLKRGNI